jgi:hypothetical protein
MFVVVHHRVEDYDVWEPVFAGQAAARAQAGATRHWILTAPDDRADVTVVVEFPSTAAATSYLADPALPAEMERAGIVGETSIVFRDVTQAHEYPSSPV